MEAAPLIQVIQNGEQVQRVAMLGDVLRIGRMKQNELVLDHLSVSRFHAVLRREGHRLVLEDLGSENGTRVNGVRIAGSVVVGPGDEVRIGKHLLVLGGGAPPATQLPGKVSQLANEVPEHTALFAFAMDEDLLRPEADPAMDLDPHASGSGVTALASESRSSRSALMDSAQAGLPMAVLEPAVYAGFIVQRGGALERVIAWDQERMCAGRARECEIRLGSARASRRHALFVHEGSQHEVRDLDSVGGVFVNGERVLASTLQVGDVVRIEDVELTFVLDQRPITEAVQTTPGASSGADPVAVTQLGLQTATRSALEPPQTDPMPEIDLLHVEAPLEEEEDKELTTAPPLALQAASSEAVGNSPASLVLELRLPLDEAPEAVRCWLEEQLGKGLCDLRIPVSLRMHSDEIPD